MILHGPVTQLLRLVTPPPLAVQLQVLQQDQEEPSEKLSKLAGRLPPTQLELMEQGSPKLAVTKS